MADQKELPKDWEVVKLGKFVEYQKGKKPKNQSITESAKYHLPYIDIEAFEHGIIKSWTDGEGCRLCSDTDFLMVWDGSRSGLVGMGLKGALGSTLMRLNFPSMENQYAYYFLLSKYQEINTRAKGSGTPHVDPDLLWNYDFPIPPYDEQKRIVAKIEELFSELDSGIASLKTAREQLKIYRQSLLKHAFEGKLTEQWRKENADQLETPEQLLTRIQQERKARYQQQLNDWKLAVKDWEVQGKEGQRPSKPKKLAVLKDISKSELSELASLPVGWSYVRLGNLIDEPTYGTSAKCEYDSGNTGVLRIPNIKNDAIDDGDLKFASFDEGEIKHFALEEGDLLTIRSNGSISLVGTCALIKEKDTRHIFAGYLIRLRPNQSSIHPSFLLAVLTSHLLRRQIETAAKSTSGVNNINSGELQNLIIPIATMQEQYELLKHLDTSTPSINTTELEIERQLLKSETLRQSILKKAFSGQLVPQDPKDEPASELLARIEEKRTVRTNMKKNKEV